MVASEGRTDEEKGGGGEEGLQIGLDRKDRKIGDVRRVGVREGKTTRTMMRLYQEEPSSDGNPSRRLDFLFD